jgi:hypothetical protein
MSRQITLFCSFHIALPISTTICIELACLVVLGGAGSAKDCIQMNIFGKAGALYYYIRFSEFVGHPNIYLTLPVRSKPKAAMDR